MRLSSTLFSLLLLTSWLSAAEPPRWKLEPGDALDYRVTQDSTTTARGDGEELTATVHQELDVRWTIAAVDDDGIAQIEQTFRRLAFSIDVPGLGAGQGAFDSAKSSAPTGLAQPLAPVFDAMLKGKSEFKLSPRGEISDWRPPDTVVEALRQSPATSRFADLFGEEAFLNLTGLSAATLPEKDPAVAPDWTDERQATHPLLGRYKATAAHTWLGQEPQGDSRLDRFETVLTIAWEQPAEGVVRPTVVEQEASGERTFDRAAGRLVASEFRQHRKLDLAFGEKIVQEETETTTRLELQPNDSSP